MQLLKKRILQDGKCYEGGILKVDGFINHQMDPVLMKSIGVEFVRRFAATNVNKIMTIEASGIAPAIMTGYLMDLPVVFAKKKSPKTIQNALSTTVHSFTKDRDYEVVISAQERREGKDSRGEVRPAWELVNRLAQDYGKSSIYAKMWVDKMRENASRGNSDGGAGDYGPNSGGYDQLGFGTLMFAKE